MVDSSVKLSQLEQVGAKASVTGGGVVVGSGGSGGWSVGPPLLPALVPTPDAGLPAAVARGDAASRAPVVPLAPYFSCEETKAS